MNEQTAPRPKPLEFDFEQWRNDIETFSAETSIQLQQIIAEIDGESEDAPIETRTFSDPANDQPCHSVEQPEQDRPSNHRLASLKERLEKRMNKGKESGR